MRAIHKAMCKRIAAAALCGLLLFLTACGSGPQPAEFKQGEELAIAVMDEPDSFNPLVAEGRLAKEFALLVYDPLWRIDANGQPVNCLAEDYSLSSDQRTWTVRLRQDVTFSDGTPLTAADVKYSYETMSLHSPVWAPYCAGIEDIRCPDDYTVVFTTSYVKGDMLLCPVPILPRNIWSKQASARDFANEEMIGSGPFVREMVDRGPQEVSWTFQARENYFGGSPNVGSLRFVLYSTESGAARALSTGEVGAAIGLTDVQLTTLEGVPGVFLIQGVFRTSQVWVVAFNTRNGVFSQTPMRQMVEYCTDRSWMLSMSSGGVGETGSVFASPATDYFYTLANLRPIDRDNAKNILITAGFNDIDEDGMMEDLMTRDDLSLRLYSSAKDDWAPTAATVLKDNLESIGVRVQWTTVDEDVESVCTPKGKWDMCLIAWDGDVNAVVAADRLRASADSLTGWENDSYEQVLMGLREAMDEETVRTLSGQLQQIAYDDCPYFVMAYRSDIQGIREDRWTGYDEVMEAAGGIFGIGTIDGYMALKPIEEE